MAPCGVLRAAGPAQGKEDRCCPVYRVGHGGFTWVHRRKELTEVNTLSFRLIIPLILRGEKKGAAKDSIIAEDCVLKDPLKLSPVNIGSPEDRALSSPKDISGGR